MTEITSQLVQTLREKTSAGMMDCKRALVETQGDMEKAIKVLREKGLASAAKRAGRVASKGLIESYIHTTKALGVLVEVNCETDFVAMNDTFKQLAKDIAMQVAAANPQYVARTDVPADVIEKEKEILKQQLMNDEKNKNKPAQVVEKIVEGRIDKFFGEICLMEQAFFRNPDQKISDVVTNVIATIGENIVVRRFTRFQLGA
jgi:elongation factor Ts